jgi:hypothetical protein
VPPKARGYWLRSTSPKISCHERARFYDRGSNRINPGADPVLQPRADSFGGLPLKDLSVFVLPRRMKAGEEVAGWTVPPTLVRLSNHQAVSDRVLDDFRTIFDASPFQDPNAIGADRFYAQ